MKRLLFLISTTLLLISAPGAIAADPRKYRSFDFAEGPQKLRLTIPEDLAVVRGILIVAPFSGGDTRDYHNEIWFREFMHMHGFAFLGADFTRSHPERVKAFRNALKQFAAGTKHPELVDVPYVATGFSAGGGFSSQLVSESPEKVIAAVIVGSRLRLNGTTDAHRGTPLCIINGEHEHAEGEAPGMANSIAPVLAEHRPKGALWSWMAVQGLGHERDAQEVLAMPILDAAVRLRYPADGDVRKGPIKLKPIDPNSGWEADNTTWNSGLTTIASFKNFKGEVRRSSWLLNEDIAFIYRAYSTFDRPLTITSPKNTTDNAREQVWDAGGSVTITVDDSKFPGWTKLELFDGAKKIAELTKGPAKFTVKDLTPGYHTFSILGADGKGIVRTSNPVLIVVRK